MIDLTRVANLRSEVGTDSFGEVVELFLEEADGVVSELKAATDPAQYEMALHFLKGSAVNLGFRDFSLLCESGEKMVARGEPEAIEGQALVDCYQTSRARFLNGLETRMW